MTNPLLLLRGLPPFAAIKPQHVEPAIDEILSENRVAIARLLDRQHAYTWSNLVEPLEELADRLRRAWSPVGHMNSVVNSLELRAAYNACLPKLSDYASELGQNELLYQAYQAIADGDEWKQLDVAQKKIIDNALRDFRLSGVALPADKKERFKAIMQELSNLHAKFEENLLDATNAWHKQITDAQDLAGLPPSARGLMAQTAKQRDMEGWVLTLEFPSYIPVITYCDNRDLRREMYEAYVTRASDAGPHAGRWDNTPVMEQILALRHESAQLLGFNNYAEYSIAPKMAQSTEQVLKFLTDLSERSLGLAKNELDEVRAFAREYHGQHELEAWDIGYYSEKLRQHRYAISKEDLKPYFPEERVVTGMFQVVRRLYGLDIRELEGVEAWHPSVRFFEIYDAEGALRGQFYLDLYARPNKRGGAWMDECIARKFDATSSQTPVAYLTCNFSPPVGDDPALFTHDEVLTLFHEFCHGLHHMLTKVDYPSVAGIAGVPWDAVELPSQFMENWC